MHLSNNQGVQMLPEKVPACGCDVQPCDIHDPDFQRCDVCGRKGYMHKSVRGQVQWCSEQQPVKQPTNEGAQ